MCGSSQHVCIHTSVCSHICVFTPSSLLYAESSLFILLHYIINFIGESIHHYIKYLFALSLWFLLQVQFDTNMQQSWVKMKKYSSQFMAHKYIKERKEGKKKKKKTPRARSSLFRIGMRLWSSGGICLVTKCLLTVSFKLMTATVIFKKCINNCV